MPQIDKSKLDAMMTEVPEDQRDAFLTDFKNRGYTIGPTQQQNDPRETLLQLASINPMFLAAKRAYGVVAPPIKALGNLANQGNQMLAQGMQSPSMPLAVQAAGGVYGKVAPYLNPIPTTDLGMATLPFVAAEGAGALASRFGTEAAIGIKPLQQAGGATKALAYALSAANRVKPNQLAAVMANPEILSEATPTKQAVSAMYEQAFEDAGMKINDARYKFLTGSAWPLRENQIGKAQKIVDMAFDPVKADQLREGLTDSEAFIARTATSKIQASAAADQATRSLAGKRQEMLDDVLENSSLPNIRQLSRLWFMANTKEAMLSPLPLNKQGSANALSTLLMAAQMKKGLEQVGEGAIGKGATNIGTGLLLSPRIGGMAIKGVNAASQNPAALMQILNNAANGQQP